MGAIAQSIPQAVPLGEIDLLFIRTNPARDQSRAALHQLALGLARRCQDQGVCVINQPDGLLRAASKLYSLELPEFTRPATLVSQDRQDILSFIRELPGPAVLKPLQGTRGNDVFFVSVVQEPNLNQIMDVILRQGPVMVQACLPSAALGDTRVLVFQGQLLEIEGQAAAIHRVPAKGDFRSNLHAGGQAQPARITEGMRQVVAAIGPKLVADGLDLVGLDFIDDQLLEVNVFSTGGLRDAERFTGMDFSDRIIAATCEAIA
jgi:glutathione synthase